MAINYQLLTSMSREDEHNLGTSIGFAKDEPLSMRYIAAGSNVLGLGEINNVITRPNFDPAAGYGLSSFTQNTGRLPRMINSTFYDPAQETTESVQNVIASGKNYSQRDNVVAGAGVAGGTVVNYYIKATIPLNILSDLFAKMPLVKGAYLEITLNLNASCSSTMLLNAAGNSYTSVSSSSQNGVVPYMISPCITTQGLNAIGTAACTSMMLSMGVARNSFSGITYNHPTLSSCRLYACLCDLSPSCKSMYLSKMPTKVVKYQDFISFQTLSVAANASFSHLTNGISRVRKIIRVPQLAANFNFAGTAGTHHSVLVQQQVLDKR